MPKTGTMPIITPPLRYSLLSTGREVHNNNSNYLLIYALTPPLRIAFTIDYTWKNGNVAVTPTRTPRH